MQQEILSKLRLGQMQLDCPGLQPPSAMASPMQSNFGGHSTSVWGK